jgi:hypothetical protein
MLDFCVGGVGSSVNFDMAGRVCVKVRCEGNGGRQEKAYCRNIHVDPLSQDCCSLSRDAVQCSKCLLTFGRNVRSVFGVEENREDCRCMSTFWSNVLPPSSEFS